MRIGLKFTVYERTPALSGLELNLTQRRRLMAAQAKRVEIELRVHFALRDREGNKRGWRRTHFWAQRVRANTSVTRVTDVTAEVTIASPEFRQRLFGGTIRPVEGKYLAIPAVEDAAGRSPRTFNDLKFVVDPEFGKALANKATGAVFFFLRRSVTQKADPRALPGDSVIEMALLDETARFLAREKRRSL